MGEIAIKRHDVCTECGLNPLKQRTGVAWTSLQDASRTEFLSNLPSLILRSTVNNNNFCCGTKRCNRPPKAFKERADIISLIERRYHHGELRRSCGHSLCVYTAVGQPSRGG